MEGAGVERPRTKLLVLGGEPPPRQSPRNRKSCCYVQRQRKMTTFFFFKCAQVTDHSKQKISTQNKSSKDYP